MHRNTSQLCLDSLTCSLKSVKNGEEEQWAAEALKGSAEELVGTVTTKEDR